MILLPLVQERSSVAASSIPSAVSLSVFASPLVEAALRSGLCNPVELVAEGVEVLMGAGAPMLQPPSAVMARMDENSTKNCVRDGLGVVIWFLFLCAYSEASYLLGENIYRLD